MTDGQADFGDFGAGIVPPSVKRKSIVTVSREGDKRLAGFIGHCYARDTTVYTTRRSGYHFYYEGGGYAISDSVLAKIASVGASRIYIHEKQEPGDVYEFPLRAYTEGGSQVPEVDLDDKSDPQTYVPVESALHTWDDHNTALFVESFDDAMDRITSKRGGGW